MATAKKWPSTESILSSAYPKGKIELTQIPEGFDKIKENCGEIAKWWYGAQLEAGFVSDCMVDGSLDFECIKTKFEKKATASGIRKIGAGQYGATFMACNDGKCDYILKIQPADLSFSREVYALTDLNGWEYAPQIYDSWTCDGLGFIVLEKMDSIKSCTVRLSKADIATQIDTIVDGLYKRDWIHNDVHPGNVMCKHGHLALIDFGAAVKMKSSKIGGLDRALKHHPLVTADKIDPKTGAIKVDRGLLKKDLISAERGWIQNSINQIAESSRLPARRFRKAIVASRAFKK